MAVTLQQIAEAAGVSRGTVDRALNNRGRIRPEVAERIRTIAVEMGYKPNRAGKALALSGHSFKIGVIVQECTTSFMQELLKGVYRAKEEVENLGAEVLVCEIRGINTKAVLEAMENFREENVQAIAINPAHNQSTKTVIDCFVQDYEIPVITFNTDLKESARLCYVGQDTYLCGKAAAGMMGEILGGSGEVAVISGYESNPSLRNRVDGFVDEMKKFFPDIHVLKERYAYDSNAFAEVICDELFEQHPQIKGVFVTAGVETGVCAALKRQQMLGTTKVIISDISPGSEELIRNNDIAYAIIQNADVQGYQPVMLLFELLFDGRKPAHDCYYTNLTIINRYNVHQFVSDGLK